MKIFIDIGHPAHVHYFKNFIKIMIQKNHKIFISARNKEITHYLLKNLDYNYFDRGKGSFSSIGKLFYMIITDFRLYRIAKNFDPDILISFGSPYLAQVSSFLGKPHIAFDDTEHAKLGHAMYVPFTDTICTPSCFQKDFRKKQIRFNGYMELCYLHPNYFKPHPGVIDILGVKEKGKYVVLRFVSWLASHDIGHKGITLENKVKAVYEFSKYAKVFISSEKELPSKLESFKINIPSEKMHEVLYYATLLYGESATMASEAAVLGTPAIYLDNVGRGYTDEEGDKYGLVFNFSESQEDQIESIKKGIELLQIPNFKQELQKRRQKMLADKIDVTAFMVWFIENYPKSAHIMNENPDYQYRFK